MNFFGIIGLVISITNIAIGLMVYFYDRKSLNNQVWALFGVSVGFWGLGAYIITLAESAEQALLWWRITHIGIILIPFTLLAFTHSFLGLKNRTVAWIGVVGSSFFLITDASPYFISGVRYVFDSFYYDGPPTLLYDLFVAVFMTIFVYIIVVSIRVYIKTQDPLKKRQIMFFTLATFVGSLGGSTSFFPVYGVYIYPYLNASIILFPFIIGYAILRHGLFNLSAIATELFIFSIWIFVLLRAVFSTNSEDVIINLILLAVLVFLGSMLIRTARQEIRTREKIEKLAVDLEAANVRLTELDRQKSEFVSFATHQLRAPLTAMKGYASMILEGDMGAVSDEIKAAISRIFESSKTLASIVDDYLNLTRIELGTMKYAFETIDLRTMVEEVIGELGPNLKKDGLSFTFTAEEIEDPWDWRTTADPDKLKQVIANIIDNSVKYTPKGFVRVSLLFDKPRHKFIFKVEDNGIGIAPETLPLLFNKFSRAGNANKTNIKGTGLGLYVAKQIVEAHHGVIYATSPGEGKGSTFVVELEPFAKA
jgi:signal transduction histidine kinase